MDEIGGVFGMEISEKPKVFRPRKARNRKTKLTLVFDEQARKEFLTGFQKRKQQRRKKAQEQLEQQLKEERKRLKQEARESYKKLVVSHRPIPELEELLAKHYELENHSVSVTEISAADLAEKQNWIGQNQVKYEEKKEVPESSSASKEELPGMEFKTSKDVKKIIKKQATKQVQKSKAFQIKNKLERHKNRKESLKKKKIKQKQQYRKQRGKPGKKRK